MAAPPSKIEPDERNEGAAPLPEEAIRVWIEVAESAASETVPLASTKSALQFANEHLQSHQRARQFVEQCLLHIVECLLNEECPKPETTDSDDIEECLKVAVIIVAKHIDIQIKRKGTANVRLLSMLLDREAKLYCKHIEGKKTRLHVIDTFQREGGFSILASYLSTRQLCLSSDIVDFLPCLANVISDIMQTNATESLSSLTLEELNSIAECVSGLRNENVGSNSATPDDLPGILGRLTPMLLSGLIPSSMMEETAGSVASVLSTLDFFSSHDDRKKDATLVASAAIRFIKTISLEGLNDAPALETFGRALHSTGELVDHVSRSFTDTFNRFYCDLVLHLVTSQSEELRLFGWKQISLLVARAVKHRPPVRTIVVSNADDCHLNGTYSLKSDTDDYGSAKLGSALYERVSPERTILIPIKVPDNIGEESLAFRLWCIISTTVDEGVGVSYMAGSSDSHQPPEIGWKRIPETVSSVSTLQTVFALADSPLAMKCRGLVVPVGEECNTVEHQLAEWAIKNRVIEIFYEGTDCFTVMGKSSAIAPLIKLLAFMGKQTGDLNEYKLRPSHVLSAWSALLRCEDAQTATSVSAPLVTVLYFMPDDIALHLIGAMQECLLSHPKKVRHFLISFVVLSAAFEAIVAVDLAFGAPRLSDEVRVEMKKILWSVRTRDNTVLEGLEPKIYEAWLKWETFRRSCKDAKQSRTQVEALDTKKTPKKPIVALLDPKGRRIQVSIPVESESGDYYVGADVYASCDGHEGEGVDLTIATIERDAIEQCLKDCNDRVVVEAVLPHTGVWNISWRGLILRKEIIKTPRSAETVIDFTVRDREQQKQQLAEIEEVDELARQHAGDIQSTIRKLRGPCSGQMEVETRFSLLYTAVVRGRSTLSKLRCLVETNAENEASVSGVSVLSDALAEAHLPMKELEAALKVCNRKDRVKGFKTHVTSLLESGDAASWIESVSRDDLESLGGDANRLYQLLVESKRSALNLRELESASARTDLFSKKQVKALLKLASETRAVEQSKPVQVKAEVHLHHKNSVKPVARVESEKASPEMIQHAVPAETREETNDITKRIVATSTSSADDFPLLTFLKEHDDCLKCSPEAFCRFLVDSEDIVSLDDLADAIGDDEYVQGILQQGGGGDGGLKGFKRAAFKKAVLVASGRRDGVVAATSVSSSENKENVHPSSVLICPLSRILMTKEPVLAADGHTYELAAIAEWFDKQDSEIKAAKRRIAAGSNSKKLRDIVERGIVSPVTHERMENLALTSNKALRAMARDAAKANNKRIPFGILSR